MAVCAVRLLGHQPVPRWLKIHGIILDDRCAIGDYQSFFLRMSVQHKMATVESSKVIIMSFNEFDYPIGREDPV